MPPRFLSLFLLMPALAHAQESQLRLIRETDALTPEQQQAKLHAPAGFEVQLFASEPMINKPINMAFDSRGRLWVSSTVEYPYAAKQERWTDTQGTHVLGSRDAIKILEDTDGDGRADKVTTFADQLNIPTGVLPWHKPEHKAGCIAWSIPNIWYFADTDGDGKADLRHVLFGPLGYEKDTHGMCSSFRLGGDGWVYATHGFSNTSHFELPPAPAAGPSMEAAKTKSKAKSAQSVAKGSQTPNPSEPLAKPAASLTLYSGNVFRFKPDGSRVESWSSGQTNPFGLCWDSRGNLYSADCHSNPVTQLLRGGCYPSFGRPHDGLGYAPVMCEHSHGSTGLCGIIYIDGGIWGPDWEHHLFLGNCVTSKVNHDVITFTGSTPKAIEQPDFITSDDPWFRPVDLQLGPDNALYIADFYNKIIGHYEVPLDHPGRDRERGRIWRVVKKDASPKARTGPKSPSAAAIADFASADPFVQRAAAAWFDEHPSLEVLPALLAALGACPAEDVALRHHLRLVLRSCLSLPGAFALLKPEHQAIAGEVAVAVPTPEAAAYLLTHWSPDRPEQATWLAVVARHGDEVAVQKVIERARSSIKAESQAVALVRGIHDSLMERGAKVPPSLLAWATELAQRMLTAAEGKDSAWKSIPLHGGDSPWCMQERQCADGATAQVISSLDRRKRTPERLTGILRSQSFPAPEKLAFWLCGHQGAPNEPGNEKNLVRLIALQDRASGSATTTAASLASPDPVVVKTLRTAYPPRNDVCQRIEWDLSDLKGQSVRLEVVDGDDGRAFAWLGIGRFEPEVLSAAAFASASEQQQQLQSLAMMLRATAAVGLRDRLRAFLPEPPKLESPKPQPEMDALLADRRAAFAKARPDPAKGEAIFTAHCAACHSLGGKGGLLGPQLDGIGNRGADRLLEDVLDPNRNVDAHFRLHQYTLRDQTVVVGFVRGEAGQVVIMADAAGNEQRLNRSDIIEDKELPMSLMPPTFGQMIPKESLYDLIAWLLKK